MTLNSFPPEHRGGPGGVDGGLAHVATASYRHSTGQAGKPHVKPSRGDRDASSGIQRVARARILGKQPLGGYLRLSEWTWKHLPRFMTATRLATSYCRLMHALVLLRGDRRMYLGTFFQRNRPQLDLVCRLADQRARARRVRMAVLGCSIGAEVYSIRWSLALSYPDLNVDLQAVDISEEVLEVAREGVYSLGFSKLTDTSILERLTLEEVRRNFESEGTQLRVKEWLRAGIRWCVADAGDPRVVEALGRQDIVVANDFLCHMEPADAERCLRNIARLVDPGGYLIVSGVDLDVRTKVARDLGWRPVRDSMEAIHDGDRSLRQGWPWGYWGLEPLDKRRADWIIRYVSVFQLGAMS